jgi:hypothetical protein
VPHRIGPFVFFLLLPLLALTAAACGARTGLLVESSGGGPEAGVEASEDAAATPDAGMDADTGTPTAPFCTAGQSPRPIASVDYVAPVLAVDDERAYFISSGADAGVFAFVSKHGGPVTPLAAAPPPNVDQLMVDDTDLWALDYAYGLYRIPKSGGAAMSLSSPAPIGTAGMGQDPAYVYYSDVEHVWRQPKSGGAPTAVVTGGGTQDGFILDLRVIAGALYWTQPDGGLYTAHTDGSAVRRIALVDNVGAAVEFTTDGTTAYVWSETFGPMFQLISVPVAGGPLTVLGAYFGNQGFFEDDALMTSTNVYFTGGPSVVDGGTARGIYALARTTGAFSLVESTTTAVIEQDPSCLYWLDDGRLFTVAK